MLNDPTVQVAAIGIVTTFITTIGVILVAAFNNRKERAGAADAGVEAMLRERITLRDEKITELREDKDDLRTKLEEALVGNEEKSMLIQHLREELTILRDRTDDPTR